MKKILILLFSILISFNSYGETFCLETDFEVKDGLIHLKNEVKPFSGKFLCEDVVVGVGLWKGSINNGKRDGKWTTWYENGQKRSKANWDNGKRDGKWTTWYDNGEKLAQKKFKNGKKVGRWREWYDDGQIKVVDFYKDGKLDGNSSKWDKNGQKTFEATYTDGKLDSNESLEENTSQLDAKTSNKTESNESLEENTSQLDAKTSNETESDTKNEGINKLTVSDVIVEEAALLGQEVMVPGWMMYFADSSMLYEYAGTMTALSVNMDNLNKKQKKWIVSKCGSGCYVNLTGVVKKDQIIMATEIEKMSFKDKMINIAIGEKNLLLN